MQFLNTEVSVVRGSVLDQDVEAVVNAANTAMRGGGGLDGQVHRQAGPGLLEELRREAPQPVPTGHPVITSGHNLRQKLVCHVAGPVWGGGRRGERQQLYDAYHNSLRALSERGVESAGVPSVSTGIYGFPIALAAPTAFVAMGCFLLETPDTSLRRIVWAMYGAEEYGVFSRTLGEFGVEWAQAPSETPAEAAEALHRWLDTR